MTSYDSFMPAARESAEVSLPEYGAWSREMLDFEPPLRFDADLQEVIMTPPLFRDLSPDEETRQSWERLLRGTAG